MTKPSAADLWSLGDYPRVAERLLPAAQRLVAATGVGPGQRILDAAAGNGNVSLLAAQAGASVTATDIAPRMVELGGARTRGLDVTWSLADVQALPFEDARFDAVLSVKGAMFAPDQPRTAAELLRVARPGGTVGITAWIDEGAQAAAMARLGEVTGYPTPRTTWGDPATARELFETAGAASVETERVELPWRFASVEAWADFMENGPGPMVASREGLGDRWPAVRAELMEIMAPALDGTNPYLQIIARRACAPTYSVRS